MASAAPPPPRLAWFIWALGSLLYLLGFFQRIAPAVMTDALMRDFQIGAVSLGNLSAIYFYSYVAMQIPTGILADVWGPRRLLSLGALVAGAGTVLFAAAPGILLAGLGRLLIGGSVAVAFVGVLKLANNWFPPRHFSLAAGLTLLVGVAGGVCAGPPLRLLMDRFGWRGVMLASAGVTFAVSAAIWTAVRDWPREKGFADGSPYPPPGPRGVRRSVAAGILAVWRYPNIWLLFIIPAGVVGPVLTFAGLWGVPFLTTHYRLPPARASVFTTALLVAWALGGPLCGWLSDRLGRRKSLYLLGCAVALGGWGVIVGVPRLPLPLLAGALVITGMSTGCMILSFAFAKESAPADLAGTITGVVNMGIMLGPTLLQPAVGWMLDRRWSGALQDGARVYGLAAYQAGFSLFIAWAALALVLLAFTRETHCRPMI
jgi:MFS family permease